MERVSDPDYDPVVRGDPESHVVVQVFANPLIEAARTFFLDLYDEFAARYLGTDTEVRFELRPIAPEMRTWVTAAGFDVRRSLTRGYPTDAQVSASEVAECAHSVRERAGDDAFAYFMKRACRLSDPSALTFGLLQDYLSDLDAEIDSEAVFADMASGRYRTRVRADSEQWFYRLPGTPAAAHTPQNTIVFVNGEAVTELSYATLSRQIQMIQTFLLTDQIESVLEGSSVPPLRESSGDTSSSNPPSSEE